MRVADLAYLQQHDSPTDWEMPASFDYHAAMREVRELGPELSTICGYSLQLDDQVQDASFFADLAAYEPQPRSHPQVSGGVIYTIVCIRFSSFGRMFMIWSNSDLHPVSEEVRERIIDCLAARGFVYVPEALLDEPGGTFDWRIRYFDYL